MIKLIAIIYATCQGGAIGKFLMESKEFNEKYYDPVVISNYEYIRNNKYFIEISEYDHAIRNADLFIYQPLDDIYLKNSTNYIKSLLKPTCKTLSIPYVFNTSLWSIILAIKGDVTDDWSKRDGGGRVFLNIEVINELRVKHGLSLNEILKLYDNNKIDFNYEIRYRTDMNLLKNKEKNMDIKVHDFIKENISKKRLFLYSSHPTSPLFIHMTNQILNYIEMSPITDNYDLDFCGLHSAEIPIAFPTSSVDYFKFEFTTKEEEKIANDFYKYVITWYINSYPLKK